eukprot:TRINITY_DN3090_c0_g1_i1.p1 TRINITY_DN3090_c0_g1~~TRINITY_DN3090_c0_g1_i1.p1  ORF type:complete len:827 (-),score=184.11 TRINITY_DN3090_c0_g1_i1:19-2499(-)
MIEEPPSDSNLLLSNQINNNISNNNQNIHQNVINMNINNIGNNHKQPSKEILQDNIIHFNSSKLINNPQIAQPIPLGFTLTPFKNVENIPILQRPPLKCSNCKCILNLHSKLDTKTGIWKCNLCSHENNSSDEESISFYPELCHDAVEYIDPTQQFSLITSVNVEEQKKTYFFLIDLNLEKIQLKVIKESIISTIKNHMELKSKKGDTNNKIEENKSERMALITFSNIISIYQFNKISSLTAISVSGVKGLSMEEREFINRNKNNFFLPFDCSSIAKIEKFFDILYDQAKEPPNFKDQNVPLRTQRQMLSQYKEFQRISQRALGSALDISLYLSGAKYESNDPILNEQVPPIGGRIFVLTNGAPNLGEGSVADLIESIEKNGFPNVVTTSSYDRSSQFYTDRAYIAAKNNFAIDLYLQGFVNFCVPVLQNAVLSNGGTLITLPDYNTLSLTKSFTLSLQNGEKRSSSISIYTSHGILVNHIIGPILSEKKQENSSEKYWVGCSDESCSFSVYYNVVEPILSSEIFFQFKISYVNSENQRIFRVVTKKIEIVGNNNLFYNSINGNVTSVLLAKKAIVLFRKERNSASAKSFLDKSLINIVKCLGVFEFANFTLPQLCSNLPKLIYLVKRGPMLGGILQHSDDIDFHCGVFLKSNFEDSMRMIDPALLKINERNVIEKEGILIESLQNDQFSIYKVPFETLSLRSNWILGLDHHLHVFVWRGCESNKKETEEAYQYLLSILLKQIENRFPIPQVSFFEEGDSMARFMSCRLTPNHKDVLQDQIKSFPKFELMNEEERKKILSKFPQTDEPSCYQYIKSISLQITQNNK